MFCAVMLLSEMPSFAVTITTSEVPATYYEISPGSTRWRVERGGRLVPISSSRVKYMRVATYHNPGQQLLVVPMNYGADISVYQQNQTAPAPPRYGASAPNAGKAKPRSPKAPSSPQNRRNQPPAPKTPVPRPNQGGQPNYMPAPLQQAAPVPQTMPPAVPRMIPAGPQGYYQTPQVAPVPQVQVAPAQNTLAQDYTQMFPPVEKAE